MRTDPIDTERAALALLEAFEAGDQVASTVMLSTSSRDELIALSVVLTNYAVSIAAVAELDLAAWIPEQRQRLADREGDDEPPVVA